MQTLSNHLFRNLRYVILLSFIQLMNIANATTLSEPINLLDMAEQADSVIIATPIEALNRRSSEGNLFTEIVLSDVQALNNGQLEFINDSFTIYLWGGVRDIEGNLATLRTPPPHILEYINGTPQLEFGTPHLFYIKNNGLVGMPFENGEFSVYIVLDSGRILSSDKSLEVVLATDSSGNTSALVQSLLPRPELTINDQDSITLTEAESLEIKDASITDLIDFIGRSRPDFIDPLFSNAGIELNPIFIQ